MTRLTRPGIQYRYSLRKRWLQVAGIAKDHRINEIPCRNLFTRIVGTDQSRVETAKGIRMNQKTTSSHRPQKHSAEPLMRQLLNPTSLADLVKKARAIIAKRQQQKPLVIGQTPLYLNSPTPAQARAQAAAGNNQLHQEKKSSQKPNKHSAERLIRLLMNPTSRAELFKKAHEWVAKNRAQKPLVLEQAPRERGQSNAEPNTRPVLIVTVVGGKEQPVTTTATNGAVRCGCGVNYAVRFAHPPPINTLDSIRYLGINLSRCFRDVLSKIINI